MTVCSFERKGLWFNTGAARVGDSMGVLCGGESLALAKYWLVMTQKHSSGTQRSSTSRQRPKLFCGHLKIVRNVHDIIRDVYYVTQSIHPLQSIHRNQSGYDITHIYSYVTIHTLQIIHTPLHE